MNILILGKGGREHALGYKFSEDHRVSKVFIFPGNPGMQKTKKIEILNELKEDDLFDFVSKIEIEFIVIGPEDYIVSGIADRLKFLGQKVYAPSILAAQLESSKIFAKELMEKYQIPTAKYFKSFDLTTALENISQFEERVVIKLSGLHAGKGVFIAPDPQSALVKLNEWKNYLSEGVVLEEFLVGHEVSMFYMCRENEAIYLGEACDYKRIFDDNLGDNTGGMGAFSPDDRLQDHDRENIFQQFVLKTLNGMITEGIPFRGTMFLGLMMTAAGPKLLEYNVRFGDPETQTFLPRIKTGFLDAFLKYFETDNEHFKNHAIEFNNIKSVHVVKSSAGYPDLPSTGEIVKLNYSLDPLYFFAGVNSVEGQLITSGGRVCGLTSLAESFPLARALCYENLNQVEFDGEHFRTDIAKGLK